MSRIDLQYDARWWIAVDLDAEPGDWVPGIVRERWAEDGLPANERLLDAVVEAVTAVVEHLLDSDPPPFHALLLHPRVNDGVSAVAMVRFEDLDEPVPLDDAVAELLLPQEMLEAPADVSRVDTAGGPAARVVQRYRMPRDPQGETVAESVVYLWVVEDDEGEPLVLTFSTAFEDLVEAEELRPLFDEVARTMALVN
jgi:hypothetical protein